MRGLLAALGALALSWAGMAALGLAMDRHHAQWSGHEAPAPLQRAGLRVGGGLLLAAALWRCAAVWGPGVGLVAWSGWLTAGALLVAATLAYRPCWTARAALACAAVAVLAHLLA